MGHKLNIKSDAKLWRCICAIASEKISASFLGTLKKLRKVTISYVVSVLPSVCAMERVGSY